MALWLLVMLLVVSVVVEDLEGAASHVVAVVAAAGVVTDEPDGRLGLELWVDRRVRPARRRRRLEEDTPRPAGSLLEGLDETLTVVRLGLPPILRSTLRSTNAIESMIEICRDHSSNVKRWRDGEMVLRWCAAGMLEAAKQFRRVKGYLHLPAPRVALDAHAAATPTEYEEEDAA